MFDRLRRAIALVLGDRSLLGQVTCSCFFRAFVTCSSSLFLLCSSLFLFQSWFVCGVLTMHSSRGRLWNVEYRLLPVISELSTVRCDRALGLWLQVHGRRVSTESRHGGARAGRQLWRPLLERGRKRRRKADFLVCATKPRRRTAVEDAKSWRHGHRSRDWRRRRASRASLRARR